MKVLVILGFSSQTQYLGKFLFLSHRPKCSQPNRTGFLNSKPRYSRKNVTYKVYFLFCDEIFSEPTYLFSCFSQFRSDTDKHVKLWFYPVRFQDSGNYNNSGKV